MHQDLYITLEKLIDTVVPMFNRTLVYLKDPAYGDQRFHIAVLGPHSLTREPGDFRPPEYRATRPLTGSRDRSKDWRFNERICATGVFVYSSWNVSAPTISFCRRIDAEEAALAAAAIEEPPWASEMYGAQDGDPVIQDIGDVSLRRDRLMTFPNIFQTRV
ncbi:hypothetical protein MMC14_001035 [Varicellaria rhodocarpa]|nr:hypothetical protein [Varicellaria rhodocarpa]